MTARSISVASIGAVLAALLLLGSHAADAQGHAKADAEACGSVAVSVSGASSEERDVSCLAAAQAIRLLERCGISPKWPIHIEVRAVVLNSSGSAIFGRFDAQHDAALVAQSATVRPLQADSAFRNILQGDFYRSILVHEVVHAVMHQNYKRQPASRAALEYPAFALQIASLSSIARERFLQMVNERSAAGNFLFNDIILALDPACFAARAYEHFANSDMGCGHLRALLEGNVDFIMDVP